MRRALTKPIEILVNVEDNPQEGLTVTFNFTQKVRSFGLDVDKAEQFAHFILAKVKEIRDAK